LTIGARCLVLGARCLASLRTLHSALCTPRNETERNGKFRNETESFATAPKSVSPCGTRHFLFCAANPASPRLRRTSHANGRGTRQQEVRPDPGLPVLRSLGPPGFAKWVCFLEPSPARRSASRAGSDACRRFRGPQIGFVRKNLPSLRPPTSHILLSNAQAAHTYGTPPHT